MDDYIGRLIADACVDRAAATQAAELPQFRIRKASTARPCAFIRSVFSADVVVLSAASSACSRSPRRFGSRVTAAGLGMGPMQGIVPATTSFTRETAGDDAAGALVGASPGRFV
jgi:hypothetical protein